jgi:hypothetical protein
MLTTNVRTQIEQMVKRMDAAIAASKSIDSKGMQMYLGAKEALACTDSAWLARAASEDARGAVTLAANGDISGAYKLI